MKSLKILTTTILFVFSLQTLLIAQTDRATDNFKKYFNETVQKVENTDKAEEKRAILNASFDKLIRAIDRAESVNRFSDEELTGLNAFKSNISEKQSELNGDDGFEEILDEDLDDFSNYVQQDIEQANRYVTLSVTTAVLIALLLILL